jgi:DNA polymerase-4
VPAFWQKKFDCIFNEVGLTASAGISVNKFVAKIASDYNKPGQKNG